MNKLHFTFRSLLVLSSAKTWQYFQSAIFLTMKINANGRVSFLELKYIFRIPGIAIGRQRRMLIHISLMSKSRVVHSSIFWIITPLEFRKMVSHIKDASASLTTVYKNILSLNSWVVMPGPWPASICCWITCCSSMSPSSPSSWK